MTEDLNTPVDDELALKYRRLIAIGRALSAVNDIDSLLERILREAKSMVNADAGTLYLRTPENTLSFAIVLNDTLGIAQGGNHAPQDQHCQNENVARGHALPMVLPHSTAILSHWWVRVARMVTPP